MSAEQDAGRAAAVRAAYAIAPGVLLAGVAGGIAFPILPIVGKQAGLSLPLIGAILAANRVGRIVSGPAVGLLTDRIGGRRLLIAGLIIQCVVFSLYWAGVTIGNPGLFFLVGRLLQGPGSVCVFVAGQALALHAGGRAHGGVAAGTVRAALSVGVPLGLASGGLLHVALGDAVTFEISAGAVVLATAMAWLFVDDRRVQVTRRPGLREALRTLADRRLVALGGLGFAFYLSAQGLILTTMYLLVEARGLSVFGQSSQLTTSVFMTILVIVEGISTLACSRLCRSPRQHARVALVAISVLPVGLVVVAACPSALGLSVGIVITAAAAGGLSAALLSLVGELSSPEDRGAHVGWLQFCTDVGGALGPIAGTTLFGYGAALPFWVSAAVVSCFIPAAAWLARQPLGPVAAPR